MRFRFREFRSRFVRALPVFFASAIAITAGSTVENHAPKFQAWRLLGDSTCGPAREVGAAGKDLFVWFDSMLSPKTSVYTYGEPTDFTFVGAPAQAACLPALAAFFNDNDWSGITLSCGGKASIDLRPFQDSGGIEFMIRGAAGGEVFNIGLIDDDSDGADRKVQAMVRSRDYITVTGDWQRVRIPFADFPDVGKWWNSEAHYEVNADVDWSRISELRFSTDKGANRSASGAGKNPVRLYFADIRFVKNCETFSNSRYWKTFASDAPDTVLDRYEYGEAASRWTANIDPKSTMRIGGGTNDRDGTKAVRVDYAIIEWGAAQRTFAEADSSIRNWSRHASMKFDFYSSEPAQTCMTMVIDAGNEAWCAPFDTKQGWQEIIVPFERFKRFEWWQPEGAVKNGRLDLERVASYDFRPGIMGKAGTLMVDNLGLTNKMSAGDTMPVLWYNQLGYETHSAKRCLTIDTVGEAFALFDGQENLALAAKFGALSPWPAASARVRCGTFTEVMTPGAYTLLMRESGVKADMTIGTGIYRAPLFAALKAFYYQRSGIALEPAFAGAWSRSAGHPDTACILHPTTGKSGVADVRGGWYDAGDYGKYIVPAGISVGTMLALYELFPACIPDSIAIPESGNHRSDLLDEVRYELDWMQRMQDDDGGVFFKVGPLKWDGFVMPEASRGPRYIIGKSTASTLDFAACLAMAARSYRKIDRPFSKACLQRASRAWDWALAHPDVREPQESGGTGAYGDNTFKDEFFWAASELFITTGKSEYRKYVESHVAENPVNGAAGWSNVGNLGLFSLATGKKSARLPVVPPIVRSIVLAADSCLRQIDTHPCRIPADQFIWGSNSYLLNYAITLCYAYVLTKNEAYAGGVADVADYIFGRNPTGYSFVTGFGRQTPLQPHHRIMGADTVALPFPGFLVGGPNGGMEDAARSEPGVYYPHKEPARAYIDRAGSYASNEVAINWNAALVFVLGFLTETLK